MPVDAFWSISVYNAQGHFQKNALNAYTVNNTMARKGTDGSVMVQFGGCNRTVPNCLPIMKGWNYMVRLYRPRPEVLNGTWSFPAAKPGSCSALAPGTLGRSSLGWLGSMPSRVLFFGAPAASRGGRILVASISCPMLARRVAEHPEAVSNQALRFGDEKFQAEDRLVRPL